MTSDGSARAEALKDYKRVVLLISSLGDRLREAQSAEREIEQILAALSGVLDFLHSFDDLRPLSTPLAKLSDAIVDLERGSRPWLLAPRTISHRPIAKRSTMHLRAYSVTWMSMLMEHGESKTTASQFVAGLLDSVTASQVARWRDNAKRNGDDKETGKRVADIGSQLPQAANLSEAKSMVRAMAKTLRKENLDIPPS